MSLSRDLLEKLEKIASETCEREGCVLYDLEFVSGSQGRGRIVRLYLDRADQQVSVQDCERVSHAFSLMLDVEDIIPGGDYMLEVSTPGLERKLSKPAHYKTMLEKVITVKTTESITDFNPDLSNVAKRLNAKGTVKEVSDDHIVMLVDSVLMKVPYSIIEKAKAVFDFDANKGQKKIAKDDVGDLHGRR